MVQILYQGLGELQGPMNYKEHIRSQEMLILGYLPGDVLTFLVCLDLLETMLWVNNMCTK